MQIAPREKVLWIEVLNLGAIYKIILYRNKVSKVVYLNHYAFLPPFANVLSKLFSIPVQRLNPLHEADAKMGDISLYEHIQNLLIEKLDHLVGCVDVEKRALEFSSDNGVTHQKYQTHLKESAYLWLYRPIAILSAAKYFQCNQDSVFILDANPFHEFIAHEYSEQIFFNKHYPLFSGLISSRGNHYFDTLIHRSMFKLKARFFLQSVLRVIGEALCARYKHGVRTANIGVDLSQDKFRLDANNDLFWLKDSGISPHTVKGILLVDYDHESFRQIQETGIELITTGEQAATKFIRGDWLIKSRVDIIGVGFQHCASTLAKALTLLLSFRQKANMDSWLDFVEAEYRSKARYWELIYLNSGVKILWSMLDVDGDKLVKAQALENINGIYTGSHWSNFPSYELWNQKCYDLAFAWGDFFVQANLKKCNQAECQVVGYVSDYLFGHTPVENSEPQRAESMFYLTYFDNMIANDLPYSENMQREIYRMLFRLLDKHDNIILNIKPKRFLEVADIANIAPELSSFIKQDRLRLFVNDSGERFPPYRLASSSDLVLGMGISTAVAECCFAGVVGFHADLTGFTNNEFANLNLDKVVFRDVSNLESAINKQVLGGGISIQACRAAHNTLDPYQDGLAYKRIGDSLRVVQDSLIQEKNWQNRIAGLTS